MCYAALRYVAVHDCAVPRVCTVSSISALNDRLAAIQLHKRHPANERKVSLLWAFVQAYLQRWGSVLKDKVNRICSGPRDCCLAPSDACRGYTIYAANTLLNWSPVPHSTSMLFYCNDHIIDVSLVQQGVS